jgi:hypothetical protein
MVMVKATKDSEAGAPEEKMFAEMGSSTKNWCKPA